MAKLQKINSRLDKSALDWKKKHHHCQAQLLEATETNLKLTQKTKKLENLCRALQVKNPKVESYFLQVLTGPEILAQKPHQFQYYSVVITVEFAQKDVCLKGQIGQKLVYGQFFSDVCL